MDSADQRQARYRHSAPARRTHRPSGTAGNLQERVLAEMTRRVAFRLEVLGAERPDELERRETLLEDAAGGELLALSRLPDDLAGREPPRRHLGVAGFDYRNGRLVLEGPGDTSTEPVYLTCDPVILDDDDLRAAARVVPETLPGYFLG